MIPYFSDVIFNTRRLALKEATTLQDTTTLTQRKSSEYSLPSEISSLLILVCLSTLVGDEKLTYRENLIGFLFLYVQSDENTLLKVDKVFKPKAKPLICLLSILASSNFAIE